MWIILVDQAGNYLRDAGTLAGSELHFDGKYTYRRTRQFNPDGKPIFKQV